MKKVLSLALSLFLSLSAAAFVYGADDVTVGRAIAVYLDGSQVDFGITDGKQVEAVTIFDYAYVPIAKIIEILTGEAPAWDDPTKTATFAYGINRYDIDTRSSGIMVNYLFFESPTGTPPVIVNSRTLIPLRMLEDALKIEMRYDADTHSVWLTPSKEKSNDALVHEDRVLDYITWFAERGDAEMQVELAKAYYFGEFVNKDFVIAALWFRRAAEQGHPDGQYNLGMCYFYGEGVAKNHAEAISWWEKAAAAGHDLAIDVLDRETDASGH